MKRVVLFIFMVFSSYMNLVAGELSGLRQPIIGSQPARQIQKQDVVDVNKKYLCCGGVACCAGCCTYFKIFPEKTVATNCLYYTSGNTVIGNFTGYHLEVGSLGKVLIALKNCAPHSSSFCKTAAVLLHLNPCGGSTGTCICCMGLGCALCWNSFFSKRQDAPEPKND